jgi:hypothetical protein
LVIDYTVLTRARALNDLRRFLEQKDVDVMSNGSQRRTRAPLELKPVSIRQVMREIRVEIAVIRGLDARLRLV